VSLTPNVPIDELKRMDAAMNLIADELYTFSVQKGFTYTKVGYNSGWPLITIKWYKNEQELNIEVAPLLISFPTGERARDQIKFNFQILARQMRSGKEYQKKEVLKNSIPFSDLRDDLSDLLVDGQKRLEKWAESDL